MVSQDQSYLVHQLRERTQAAMDRLINIRQRFRDAGRRGGQKVKRSKPKKISQQARDTIRNSTPQCLLALSATGRPVTYADETTQLEEAISSFDTNRKSFEQLEVLTSSTKVAEPAQESAHQQNVEPECYAEREDCEVSDEQAIREEAYIISTGEEPDDYTKGPARLVVASDGVKPCVSLLLTYEFSGKVQNALRAQRDFARSRRMATRQLELAFNLEMDLETEIAKHESRLAFAQADEEITGDVMDGLQAELSTHHAMLKDAANTRQATNARLENESRTLFEIQAEANAYLEDAFVSAQLLEPDSDDPDTELQGLDLQTEYQKFRQEQEREDGREAKVVALDTNNDHLKAAPLTPEEQALLDLRVSFWNAQRDLHDAQVAFDCREETRAQEWVANFETAARGEEPMDASPDDFDARWVGRIHELTHGLIEAEVAFATAKKKALEAGIDGMEDDQASGFVDDVADGYRASFEQEQIASVPEPKVSSWLDNVPDQASPTLNDDVEVDEWDTQTVGISDSVSLVAEGPDRRRIEKWRRICGL